MVLCCLYTHLKKKEHPGEHYSFCTIICILMDLRQDADSYFIKTPDLGAFMKDFPPRPTLC